MSSHLLCSGWWSGRLPYRCDCPPNACALFGKLAHLYRSRTFPPPPPRRECHTVFSSVTLHLGRAVGGSCIDALTSWTVRMCLGSKHIYTGVTHCLPRSVTFCLGRTVGGSCIDFFLHLHWMAIMLALNVRVLVDKTKRRDIFNLISFYLPAIVCIQKSHLDTHTTQYFM